MKVIERIDTESNLTAEVYKSYFENKYGKENVITTYDNGTFIIKVISREKQNDKER